MEKIKVEINWEEKNYSCGWGCKEFGAVIATGKDINGLKAEFESMLKEQIASMLRDGEPVPEWLARGDWKIEYTFSVSSILRQALQITTMAAISRLTGINQKLLGHYASALKIPRPAQRERIISGLHQLGTQLLAIQ